MKYKIIDMINILIMGNNMNYTFNRNSNIKFIKNVESNKNSNVKFRKHEESHMYYFGEGTNTTYYGDFINDKKNGLGIESNYHYHREPSRNTTVRFISNYKDDLRYGIRIIDDNLETILMDDNDIELKYDKTYNIYSLIDRKNKEFSKIKFHSNKSTIIISKISENDSNKYTILSIISKQHIKLYYNPIDDNDENYTIVKYVEIVNDREKYIGNVNINNEPDGYGYKYLDNKLIYFGQFKNGKRDGIGIAYEKEYNAFGQWNNDKLNGFVMMKEKRKGENDICGNFINGKLDGFGYVNLNDTNEFIFGNFNKDICDGIIMSNSNKNAFRGKYILNHKRNNFGIQYYEKSNSYYYEYWNNNECEGGILIV